MDTETGRVKLTDLASCGGYAAKYSAARLEQLLAGFVPTEAENLLVGLAPAALEDYEGISVFYAAGPPEAQLCGAQRVGVIGGGNSAIDCARTRRS